MPQMQGGCEGTTEAYLKVRRREGLSSQRSRWGVFGGPFFIILILSK